MKIKNCRNCNHNNLIHLFSLGKMSFTGKFPKSFLQDVPKAQLDLLMCKNHNNRILKYKMGNVYKPHLYSLYFSMFDKMN